jgi:tetratricopeptide (TPR) repeat protein
LLFAIHAEAAPLSQAADTFLRELDTPESARRALLEKIEDRQELCVVESGGSVYGFAAGRAAADKDNDVKFEIDAAKARLYALRARRALVLHLAGGRVDRNVYPDDEALGSSLYVKYGTITGSQSVSETVGEWTMALVWVEPETAKVVRETPLDPDELSGGYYSFLYGRGKELFDVGQYSEALPILKQIHDFRWADAETYMDAAECFLKMDESGECLKLLRNLVDTLGQDMGSDALTRAGRLFREAGDKDAALSAFKLARARYREGK